jgi:hypothetical protein
MDQHTATVPNPSNADMAVYVANTFGSQNVAGLEREIAEKKVLIDLCSQGEVGPECISKLNIVSLPTPAFYKRPTFWAIVITVIALIVIIIDIIGIASSASS